MTAAGSMPPGLGRGMAVVVVVAAEEEGRPNPPGPWEMAPVVPPHRRRVGPVGLRP